MTMDKDIIRLLRVLFSYFEKKGYRYALIGANVPLILIDQKEANGKGYGIRPTYDVDLTVEIEDWDDYQRLKQDLMKLGLVQKDRQPDHRFFMDDLIVDILPYGEAIAKDGVIEWPGTGDRMNVIGFEKLFQYAKMESIVDDVMIPVIPLSLLVFTKILAYLDRKAPRDLQDILYVLEHYEEASVSERRFDVVSEDKLSYETSGAFLIAQDLKKVISNKESGIVHEFLCLFDDEYAEIVQLLVRESRKESAEILELFSAFRQGMEI
ncbi:hypothetical protein KJ762_15000 [bacterium]|nr:hypothetical protein [bacterium]MBU1064394.1 hypothetical protein [bacterium]MBU1635795.1 hypothetical protein [bacterium]MBU1873965.1 hypothetical protein [bacterium]